MLSAYFLITLSTLHLFFLCFHISATSDCSGSTDAAFLSEQCESHITFPRITFTYLFIAHTYPSVPFFSVFFIKVFLLSVYIDHSSTFFLFVDLFFIIATFCQSIPFVIDFNKTIGGLIELLSFNVYVTPSICCARQNIKLTP